MNTRIQSLKRISVITFLMFMTQFVFGQNENSEVKGIKFFHGSFAEALTKAEQEDKLIFMDAFTTWCGPCKRMAASVFPDENVGAFYNANFINLKVDMEKGEGPGLAQRYGVKSYPTLLYIGADGKVVHQGSGARPADAFIELGQDALKKFDKSIALGKLYNEGKRDAATVLAYIKALNQVGKPSLRIANEYLSAQKDLTTKENLEIILESTTEADSRIFEFLVKNKEAIIKLKSKQVYDAKLAAACKKTFKKSLEYRNEGLLLESQDKMKMLPEQYDEFKCTTDLEYYGSTGNVDKFLEAAKLYISKVAKEDASKHKELSQICLKFFKNDSKAMSLAEKSAKKALDLKQQQDLFINYGRMLYHNGKKDDAIEIVKKGLDAAKMKGEPTNLLDQTLREWGVNTITN